VRYGIGYPHHDDEGRVTTLEFEKFFVISSYVPNAGQGLKRLDYRIDDWDPAFSRYLNDLKKQKHVILCGDLNVAHQEIDLSNPKSNKKTPGFTTEERESFTKFLDGGWIDTFRNLHPTEVKYSFFSAKRNSREKGIGWRLDYFVVNKEMQKAVKTSDIDNVTLGSDHCPIEVTFELNAM